MERLAAKIRSVPSHTSRHQSCCAPLSVTCRVTPDKNRGEHRADLQSSRPPPVLAGTVLPDVTPTTRWRHRTNYERKKGTSYALKEQKYTFLGLWMCHEEWRTTYNASTASIGYSLFTSATSVHGQKELYCPKRWRIKHIVYSRKRFMCDDPLPSQLGQEKYLYLWRYKSEFINS